MDKHTIIITDSPTNDFMSPREKFQKVRVNIGLPEANRLLGEGEHFGQGPLPAFLSEAIKAKKQGQNLHSIFLRDWHNPNDPLQEVELLRFGNHNLIETPGAEFVSPFLFAIPHSEIINTTTLSMPLREFHNTIKNILGKDIFELNPEEKGQIQFILAGVYTDIRVINTAFKLRHDYGFPNVYVSPHLVGSKNHKAHIKALQVDFPNSLVTVVSGLKNVAEIAGLRRELLNIGQYAACKILPEEIFNKINNDQRTIIENLFLFYSQVELVSLSGGYSGSLLFIANGEKDGFKTEQVILKIDHHSQMQKEIEGYNLVKDFLGKHAPGFGLPVFYGEYTGVKMELASMTGKPETMQTILERSGVVDAFLSKFENALDILKNRLYGNIKKIRKIYPYKEFGLHNKQQQIWLIENTGYILPDQNLESDTLQLSDELEIPNSLQDFGLITKHIDRIPAQISLCHGDLNLANVIVDAKTNIWFIDWTYTGEKPVEIDIAKMENDIKFVLSKNIQESDLGKLKLLEGFFIQNISLPKMEELPDSLFFVSQDIQLAKIYSAVKVLRDLYVDVKENMDPLYKLALLKYSTHTLSFDERRGRGECKLPQLKYALLSTLLLIRYLKQSTLHKKTNKDKPDSYPNRFPIPQDKLSWSVEYLEYDSPYYVAHEVLENDFNKNPNGWADPEDFSLAKSLNPNGRTGLRGRGLLGKWGANFAVDPVVTRINPITEELEVLLTRREDNGEWALPGSMQYQNETIVDTAFRAIKQKTGLQLNLHDAHNLFSGLVDDYRNTDHAWMESTALHKHISSAETVKLKPSEGKGVSDVAWVVLSPEIVQNLFANHANFIKKALERLFTIDDPEIDKNKIQELLLTIL
ncbi:MAG: phosphotransferase [Leptospiraceae bacterium]|nr:phosphotransferase [Leptospiraceae bacterium]MCP5493031.1 phosphotransferase [Leptospiraceae bacterium]